MIVLVTTTQWAIICGVFGGIVLFVLVPILWSSGFFRGASECFAFLLSAWGDILHGRKPPEGHGKEYDGWTPPRLGGYRAVPDIPDPPPPPPKKGKEG